MRPLPFLLCCLTVLLLPLAGNTAESRLQHVAAEGPQLVFTLADERRITLSHVWIAAPDAAARYAQRWVGQTLRPTGSKPDRYGRESAIVSAKGSTISLQEQLLAEGLALLYPTASLRPVKRWQQAERAAEKADRGWWQGPDCGGSCTHADEVAVDTQPMQLVSGRVTRTYKGRDAYYINFGADWKTDFSLMIPRRAWRSFGERLLVPDGALIRARGKVIRDNGPMIVITRPEQMELRDGQP